MSVLEIPSRLYGLIEQATTAIVRIERRMREREAPAPAPRPAWSPSSSLSELRRKHVQGTCNLLTCEFRLPDGTHARPPYCLQCSVRPRLSGEANFCKECSEAEAAKVVVVLCQHPHGLGICGKKEPCEDHTPSMLRLLATDSVFDAFDAFLAGTEGSSAWSMQERKAVRIAIDRVREALRVNPT